MKDGNGSHPSSEKSGEAGSINYEQQEDCSKTMEKLSLGSDHDKGSPMNSDYEGDDIDSEIEREAERDYYEMIKFGGGCFSRPGNFSDDDELDSYRMGEDGKELYRVRIEDNVCDKTFRFMELLTEIGCESGFVRRSKFMDDVFYAKLSKDEAEVLDGKDDIFCLFPSSELICAG